MTELDKRVCQRLDELESKVRVLEDQLAIYQVLAKYGPSVDSRSRDATGSLWIDNGRYDFGGAPLVGAAEVGKLVDCEPHVSYVARGSAHVMSIPIVEVNGDKATATGYSRVYLKQDDGWKVERVAANRWEFVRTDGHWRVENRTNRLLDGSPEARSLLAMGANNA